MELNPLERKWADKAAALCAAEERCADDIEKKLNSWGASPESVRRIREYLCENDYLNEDRYVKAFALGKLHQLKWGRTKIAYHLRMKRVDEKAIETGLLDLDEADYRSVLQSLAESKWKSIHESDEFVKKGKLTAFLQSHGFESYEIQNILKIITNNL